MAAAMAIVTPAMRAAKAVAAPTVHLPMSCLARTRVVPYVAWAVLPRLCRFESACGFMAAKLATNHRREFATVAAAWPPTPHGSCHVGPIGNIIATPMAVPNQSRRFATTAVEPKLSAAASRALGNIKESVKRVKTVQLTRAQKRKLEGNIRKYKLMGDREEFHNVDRNKYGRIFEPWHNFEIHITSSKNNCWMTVKNKGWKFRCVFSSSAGNVGFRGAMKKTEAATSRIAMNVARKLKRLGVTVAEVKFRKIMKVETCLQAFQSVGLRITRLTHLPRLPHGNPSKPRKMRRV